VAFIADKRAVEPIDFASDQALAGKKRTGIEPDVLLAK